MNPEMERRIQEARDAGYSEEEIQAELAIMQGTAPAPQVEPQTPIDRTEEYTGLAQGIGTEGALTAAKIAGLGAVGGYGLKKLGDVIRGPVAPATPATPPGATQRTMQSLLGSPGSVTAPMTPNPAVSPSYAAPAAPQAAPAAAESSMMNKASDVVRKLALDKVLKGAGIAGGAYELGKGLFYTSPEEIAILKQQEAKKRAQGWKPINER